MKTITITKHFRTSAACLLGLALGLDAQAESQHNKQNN